MRRVGVASSSQLAADAGAAVAALGGNAVDAAIAASLVQLVTEPGVVSLGAGAFFVIRGSGGTAEMIDGANEMPGRGAPPERFGEGGREVLLAYGGGTPTTVGYGSVATPGAIAACGLASRRHGRLPWEALVTPAARCAREGFALPRASERYLDHTHEGIFGWNPAALGPLRNRDGSLKRAGEQVRLPALADCLETIGREGPEVFYGGEIGRRMADEVAGNGGLLGQEDLMRYEARTVAPLEVQVDDWHLATVPAPSVGGAALCAMLLMLRGLPARAWTPAMVAQLVQAQTRVLCHREQHLDRASDVERAVADLVETACAEAAALTSPSTVHSSAADSDGLACAVTASAGYGAGVLVPETGIWLNNSLGEAELNRRGFHALTPGTRLPSNMAPTTGVSARGDVLAIGSPGADRITTAILQTLINFVHLHMPLQRAVDHPRLHVERTPDGALRVAFEPGLPVDALDVPQRCFDGLDMFFGGVSAVCFSAPDRFELAADARRTGGVAVAAAP